MLRKELGAFPNSDLASEFELMSDFIIKDFVSRLRLVVGDESVNRFAKRAEITEGSLRQYLAGSVPGADKAARLAGAGGVTLDWLLTGEGAMRPQTREAQDDGPAKVITGERLPDDFRLIPRLDIHASAGSGALVHEEEPSDSLAFRSEWLHRRGINATAAQILTARGDSMEPTLRDGDILLVDTSIDRVVDNAIYVVVYAGRTLVKRIQLRRDGSVVLKSDNKDVFDEEIVSAAEVPDLTIAGRVMWYGRSI